MSLMKFTIGISEYEGLKKVINEKVLDYWQVGQACGLWTPARLKVEFIDKTIVPYMQGFYIHNDRDCQVFRRNLYVAGLIGSYGYNMTIKDLTEYWLDVTERAFIVPSQMFIET